LDLKDDNEDLFFAFEQNLVGHLDATVGQNLSQGSVTLIISLLGAQFVLVFLSSFVADQSVEFCAICIALYSYISQRTALSVRSLRTVFLLFALDLCYDFLSYLIVSQQGSELSDSISHRSFLYMVSVSAGFISQITKIVLVVLLWRASVKYNETLA